MILGGPSMSSRNLLENPRIDNKNIFQGVECRFGRICVELRHSDNMPFSRRGLLTKILGLGMAGAIGFEGRALGAPAPNVVKNPASDPDPKALFDVRQFGARGDGRHNDTQAIQSAIDAAGKVHGTLFIPQGTFLVRQLTIPSYVGLWGAGMGQTILKQAGGSHTDLLKTLSFDTLTGTNSIHGVAGVTLSNLTLDGNRDHNSSGWGLRRYGYRWVIENVEIRHMASGGFSTP